MSKGDSKKEMLDRFEKMGIPKPMPKGSVAPPPAKNKEMASKLDQIRNGRLKENFSTFIEKAEKTSSSPTTLPVPKVGSKPGEKAKNAPKIENYAPKKSSQASMYESMLYGESEVSSSAQSPSEVQDFGPKSVDTKSLLRDRLNKKQSQSLEEDDGQKYTQNLGLTDAELTEKITEIAKEVSKTMIKSVILEMKKNGNDVIKESKNVRKAEIVGKNKIKIGNKTFLVKAVE